MITELHTARLYLRKINTSDCSSLFKIWSDPDVTRFMNIRPFTDEKQAEEMISIIHNLFLERKAIRYCMIDKESNEIIGSCGYNLFDFENEKTEIGYDLAQSFWGKGYASEAVSSLLDYAFSYLKLNRIEAKVDPQNVNSIKLLQKLDFTFEGTLRQYEKVDGKFNDMNLYSKLKSD